MLSIQNLQAKLSDYIQCVKNIQNQQKTVNLSQDQNYLVCVSALNHEQQQFQDIIFKFIDKEYQNCEGPLSFFMENEEFSLKPSNLNFSQNLVKEINNLSNLINKLSSSYLNQDEEGNKIDYFMNESKLNLNEHQQNRKSRKHSLLSPTLFRKNRKFSDDQQ